MDISIEELFKYSYVITIDKDRYSRMSSIFQQYHIPTPKLYDGITLTKYIGNIWISEMKEVRKFINLTHSVGASHQALVHFAKMMNFPYILIFEDDIFPCNDVLEVLLESLISIPDNVDCALLGNIWDRTKHIQVNNSWDKIDNIQNFNADNFAGAHAYIIFNKAYDRYIDIAKNIDCIADRTFLYLENVYITKYPLFIQINREKSNSFDIGINFKGNNEIIEKHYNFCDIKNTLKKIVNITFLRNQYNYGQRLQSYALTKFIEDNFNVNVYLADFERKNQNFRDFKKFEDEYFKLISIEDISKYDTILYGGDQIFNGNDGIFNSYRKGNPIAFNVLNGSFFKSNKKISYSASDDNWIASCNDNDFNEKYFELKNFNSISLRERSSVEDLKRRFQNFNIDYDNISYHIDPVFLLTKQQWEQILLRPNNIQEKFIFKYVSNTEPFKKMLINDQTVYQCNINCDMTQHNEMPDPREWIWYINNADKVITNSFHGFAFSIIFNRKIECNYSNNYRIQQLIDLLNIKIENGVIVNYDEVLKNIETERQRSFNYLKEKLIENEKFYFSYKCYNNEIFKRKQYCSYSIMDRDLSTSGGTSAELAKYIFSNNGIVYGASYSDDFKSVNIIPVYNMEDYYKHIAHSKYSFSLLPKFKDVEEILKSGRLVMFTGLPCQIKALKLYLKNDYENLLTVELLCSGISSNRRLKDLIEKIEKENNSKVVSFDMRYKHKSICAYILENGKTQIIDCLDSYQYFINSCRLKQCQRCDKHFGSGYADIVLGDFWNSYNNGRVKDKSFSPEKGTNIVFIESEKGNKFFKQIDVIKKQI